MEENDSKAKVKALEEKLRANVLLQHNLDEFLYECGTLRGKCRDDKVFSHFSACS
jgi:hypothetical protein